LTLFNEFIVIQVSFSFLTTYPRSLYKPHAVQFSLFRKLVSTQLVSTLNLYTLHRNSLKIKTMVSMCKKHLFLGTKAIFLSFLILAASATLVVAARASNLMEPKLDQMTRIFQNITVQLNHLGLILVVTREDQGIANLQSDTSWSIVFHTACGTLFFLKKKKNLACL